MSIIPNINSNNYNQKIKIQLTNNNECIIQTLEDESINKIDSKNNESITNNSFYFNNNNDYMNLSKSVASSIFNQNSKINNPESNRNPNEKENISNLLISFSSISQMSKSNNENISKTNNNILSNKKIKTKKLETPPHSTPININKEKDKLKNKQNNIHVNKCNLNTIFSDVDKENDKSSTKIDVVNLEEKTNNDISSFNNNDLNEISIGALSLNINDKSENYDKVNIIGNSETKSFNTSNNLNSTITANKNNFSSSKKNILKNSQENTEKSTKNKISNGKTFKNCIIENIENLNIIQKKNNSILHHKYNMPEQIEPKHCANFSFEGVPLNSKIYHNNNNFELKFIGKNNSNNTVKNNSPENLNIIVNNNKNSVINCNNIEINKYSKGGYKRDNKKKNVNIFTNVKLINEDIRNSLFAINNININRNHNLSNNNNSSSLISHTGNTFCNSSKEFQINLNNKKTKQFNNATKSNSNKKQNNSLRNIKPFHNEINLKKNEKRSVKYIMSSENSEKTKSILHNKTRSGSGVMNNNSNKNGCEYIRQLKKKLGEKNSYIFKKFKSISPKNEHKNFNKTLKRKSKNFPLNKNTSKKTKVDIILGKNIISLNKNKHKSLSPNRKNSNNKNINGKINYNNIKCFNNNSNNYPLKNDKNKILFPNSIKRNSNPKGELSANTKNSKSKSNEIKKNKKQTDKNKQISKNINFQNNLLIQENCKKNNSIKKSGKLINTNHITFFTNKNIANTFTNPNNNIDLNNSNNSHILLSGNSLVLNNIINANKNISCNNSIISGTKNMNIICNTKYNTSINYDSNINMTNAFYNNINKNFFSESSLKNTKLNENSYESNLISSYNKRLDSNENTNTKGQHVEVIQDFSRYKKICKVINVNKRKNTKDNNLEEIEDA